VEGLTVHFLVLAWDVPGDDGVARRDGARAAHSTSIRALFDDGQVVLGAGLLDDAGTVRGSIVVVDYPDREAVDEYLAHEPFVTEGVWERIEVHPLRLPDFYLKSAVERPS
jgi:uncharacterized protein